MMKAQTILGDVFVAMFFLILILGIVFIFYEHIPNQLENIKQQKACAESETLSKFLFESVEEYDLVNEPFVINYSKFYNKTYREVLNATGSKSSFRIDYLINSFTNERDELSFVFPNESRQSFNILRDRKNIVFRAGSNDSTFSFSLRLLFPHCKINRISNTSNVKYSYNDSYSTSYVNIRGQAINDSNYEQVNISLSRAPEVIYLKEPECTHSCDMYIGSNNTYIEGSIGSQILYRQEDYCTIKRRGLFERNNSYYSADIEIKAW